MDTILLNLLYGVMLSSFNIYCWKKLLYPSKKIKINLQDIGLIIFFTFISNISNYIFPQPFRLIIIFTSFIAINYFFVTKEIKKSILLVLISQMILAFVETSFIIIYSIVIGSEIDTTINNLIPSILLNCYILIVSCLICRTKIIYQFYSMFLDNKNIKKNFENFFYPIMIIFIMIFFFF